MTRPAMPPPWRHQTEAADAVIALLRERDRVQLHMACGTGKTRVGAMVASALDADLAVWAVPTIELMAQTGAEVARFLPGRRLIYVGASHEKALGGVETSNDPVEIARRIDRRTLVVTTYQSIALLGVALQSLRRQADIIVGDEAHKSAGLSGRMFGRWLDDRVIAARKRLPMTATPRVVVSGIAGFDVLSMDNDAAFGPVAYRYPFAQAVADGVICDVDALVPIIEGADTPEARAQSLLTARDRYSLHKVLSFHATIDEASQFAEVLRAAGAPAFHLSGRSSRRQIDAVRARLGAGEPTIVTNARLFSEGIDVPALDAVFFSTFKRSVVDITQQIGRAVRRAPGKDRGYVILPPAATDDLSVTLEKGRFRPMWEIVSGILDTRQMTDERVDRGSVPAPPQPPMVVGGTVQARGIVTDEFARLLEIRRIGIADYAWARTAERVVSYIKAGGKPYSAKSPYRSWMIEAARTRKANGLSAEQRGAFQRVEDAQNAIIKQRYERLERYVSSVERGGKRSESLTEEINKLARNKRFADLHVRLEKARRASSSSTKERIEKFLDAYESGGIPNQIDQNIYATLLKGGSHQEFSARFTAIHSKRMAEAEQERQSRIATVAELRSAGLTVKHIAERTGHAIGTVRRYLAEAGYE